MNSQELKKEFPNIYSNFFQENPIVISMPFIMTWSGDYSILYNGINIKQKIPLRMYVGIKFDKSTKIDFNKITYYNFEDKCFKTGPLYEYSSYFPQVLDLINEKYNSLLDKYSGIKINILSELPRSVGLGFDSIFSTLISAILERIEGGFMSDNLYLLKGKKFDEIWNDHNDFLGPIFGFAWNIVNIIKLFPVTGNQPCSFYDSKYPIISFSEDVSVYLDKNNSNYTGGGKKSQAFRFEELVGNIDNLSYLPIDYGIIYSGQPVYTEQVLYSNIHVLDWIYESKVKLRSLLGKFINKNNKDALPDLYLNFLDTNNSDFERVYSNLMLVGSLEIFEVMSKLYLEGYSEININRFIVSLNKFRYSNYVRDFSNYLSGFISYVIQNLGLGEKEIGIIPNDTTVMGGCINFILPLELHRKGIDKLSIDIINKYGSSGVIYLSWVDGIETEGIKFEQDISEGLYSQFISKEMVLIQDVDGKIRLENYNIENFKLIGDICLDSIDNKIYIKGRRLSSKDISSQSATIEILAKVLDNVGVDISNKDLSSSSYSKNKNEMLGKIIIPLIKLINDEFNIMLPLICKGSLNEFYIKLEKTDLKISLIRKLNN